MIKYKAYALGTVCMLLFTACGNQGSTVLPPGEQGVFKVETADRQVITVNSRETVKVVPDLAEIIYAVTTENKDAAACQAENKEKLNQLVETLKQLGVEESSIQTSAFDLNPRHDWERDGAITGYEAVTQVTVTGIPLEQAGLVMEKSVESGVNQIQSVSFLSSSYDESYQEALKMAVSQAYKKAQALAEASGCTLGEPVQILEHASNDRYRYADEAKLSRSAAAMGNAEASAADMAAVMPGEIDVEANISVEYAIQ